VFGVIDNQQDVMMRGAFSHTLKGRVQDIKLLWQHQQDEPIGVFTQIAEDERGLYVEGKLLMEIQRAREAHALLTAGAVSGLSIGYSPIRYRIDEVTGVRKLAEVELWEISLVTFPANEAAQVTVVKQLQQGGQLVALAEALDRAIGVLRL
jgi:HK97 family phage prohead protease